MGDTLEESVKSIYTQVSAEFEILVVDGGSSDDSPVVLDKLETECDRVRSIRLDKSSQRRLGEERNIGVREANGEYILLQMDADDRYDKGIVDFVEVYHQLEERIEQEFYLKGDSINMAPREFLLRYGPYRNIHAGEDKDLWRRLFADNAIIWLEHNRFFEEIKDYKNTFRKRLSRALDKRAGVLQSGVSLVSCFQWAIESDRSVMKEWTLYLFAYPLYFFRESYDLPPRFNEKKTLHEEIERNQMTLSEIESSLDQSLDREALSTRGQDIFFDI
jgi:glycosyltransferase involved in cell wall biosynthesis